MKSLLDMWLANETIITEQGLTNAQAHHHLFELQLQSLQHVQVLQVAKESHPTWVLIDSVWFVPYKTQGTNHKAQNKGL